MKICNLGQLVIMRYRISFRVLARQELLLSKLNLLSLSTVIFAVISSQSALSTFAGKSRRSIEFMFQNN